jgi:CysZ protein
MQQDTPKAKQGFLLNYTTEKQEKQDKITIMKEVFAGIALLAKTPRLWPLALGPLIGAFILYALLGITGGFWLVPLLEERLGEAAVFGKITALLLWLLLFPYLFLVLASAFTGIAFEPLARAVEQHVTGTTPPQIPLTHLQSFQDSATRLFVNVTIGLTIGGVAFVAGLFFPPLSPVLSVLAASVIGLLDYTSVGYLRQGKTLRAQWKHLRSNLGADVFGFALVAGLLSLVPLLGVLFMPSLIAGGTLLALKKQKHTKGA